MNRYPDKVKPHAYANVFRHLQAFRSLVSACMLVII